MVLLYVLILGYLKGNRRASRELRVLSDSGLCEGPPAGEPRTCGVGAGALSLLGSAGLESEHPVSKPDGAQLVL